MPSGRAVLVYDAFGQQVQDRIAALWHVGAVEVIKAAVLADDDDHVLDRCRRVRRCLIGAMDGYRGPYPSQGSD
jgi:hypothetical protein